MFVTSAVNAVVLFNVMPCGPRAGKSGPDLFLSDIVQGNPT